MAKQTFTTGQVLTAAQMTSLQQTAMGGGSATAKTASYVLVAADAGTVIQMNAAGATTITVNTALFAAGDTVQIQNIGAGVCTVTAGTATVSTAGSLALSQYEGGQLYFTATSASIFFDIVQSSGMTNPLTTTGDTIYSSSGTTPDRLGIGTTGQVLTVASGLPSWATSTSGGLTLLSTTTLSGSSVTVSSISGSYTNLRILILSATNSQGSNLSIRLNGDTGSNYSRQLQVMVAGTQANETGTGNTNINLGVIDTSTNASDMANGMIEIPVYTNALDKVIFTNTVSKGGASMYQKNGIAIYDTSSAITSFTIFPGDGGTFSQGTLLIYGEK